MLFKREQNEKNTYIFKEPLELKKSKRALNWREANIILEIYECYFKKREKIVKFLRRH